MASLDIKCPECGVIQMIDEAQLGETLTCPKCKESFTAEAGDTYGFVGDEPPAAAHAQPVATRHSHVAGKSRSESKPEVETDSQREIRERMEKWAAE